MNTDELIRKQTNWIKAVFGALAAIVLAIVIFGSLLIPKVYKAVDDVERSLTEINVLIQDADKAVQNINKVDSDHLKESVDNLSTITAFLANIFGNSKN